MGGCASNPERLPSNLGSEDLSSLQHNHERKSDEGQHKRDPISAPPTNRSPRHSPPSTPPRRTSPPRSPVNKSPFKPTDADAIKTDNGMKNNKNEVPPSAVTTTDEPNIILVQQQEQSNEDANDTTTSITFLDFLSLQSNNNATTVTSSTASNSSTSDVPKRTPLSPSVVDSVILARKRTIGRRKVRSPGKSNNTLSTQSHQEDEEEEVEREEEEECANDQDAPATVGQAEQGSIATTPITTSRNGKITGAGVRRLRNIFATPLSFTPHHGNSNMYQEAHLPGDGSFLKQHLKGHYLFESIKEHEMDRLVTEFEPIMLPRTEGTENTIIIQQGEWVTDETAYFYIVYSGQCRYVVNDEIVGEPAGPGDCFGELALLYNCPRAATVTALTSQSDVRLFRIHQTGFRRILQQENVPTDSHKLKLLDGVPFLKNITTQQREQLAQAMTAKLFEPGDVLISKGSDVTEWFIIERGQVRIANIDPDPGDTVGTHSYQDFHLSDGETFGERAIVLQKPVRLDVIANTDGLVFTIDRDVFGTVLGGTEQLTKYVEIGVYMKKLKGIPLFGKFLERDDTNKVLGYLANQIQTITYPAGHVFCTEGEAFSSRALYFVRKGKVRITKKWRTDPTEPEHNLIHEEYYFGDDQLLGDADPLMVGQYTAWVDIADGPECILGVLKLESCRRILWTKEFGTTTLRTEAITTLLDSLLLVPGTSLSLHNFERHTILGSGTFGQVWLATRKYDTNEHNSDNNNNNNDSNNNHKKRVYALKIQSKYELIKNGQAKGVINEKHIMEQLHHPFLGGLITSFQDPTFIYMVMPVLQGGELYTVMNPYMPEPSVIFYCICIIEALTYMHRRGFVYRDLKPENVLLDEDGYAVLVDFGFAKYVLDKTFTLCGTPLYIAPEVILNRGHNYSADHWSFGCLIFEMLSGHTPFYRDGMDQSELFRAIVKGKYMMPPSITNDAQNIIEGLLQRHSSRRLGNIYSGGVDELVHHHWLQYYNHDHVLLKLMTAPTIPAIGDPLDASNFDDWSHQEDKSTKRYPPLNEDDERMFLENF